LNPYRGSQNAGVYILDTVAIQRKVRHIPKAKRRDVTRAEYNALVDLLNERGQIIAKLRQDLDTQFKRIAQIQVQLDEVRRVWVNTRTAS
jgi:septal ring factor EnvC (AmiA/AmiB activator)